MQSRRAQRGVSMTVVVILIVLTAFLMMAGLAFNAKAQNQKFIQKQLQEAKKQEEARRDRLQAEIYAELEATGMRPTGGDLKTLEAQRVVEEYRKRVKEAFEPLADKYAQITPENQAKLQELEGRIQRLAEATSFYPTLQDLVRVAAARLVYAKTTHDQLQARLELAQAHARTRSDMRETVTKRKVDYKSHLSAAIDEVGKQHQAADERYTARLQELQDLKTELDKKIEDETAIFDERMQRVHNQITQKQDELEKLKVSEAITYDSYVVHGRVLRPDVAHRIAFIDIGSRDRVVEGLKFIAAKPGLYGRLEYKAQLEVKKVWASHAEVSITRVFSNDAPVADGDVIVNPLFNARRPVVVAFAGAEQVVQLRPAWSRAEAARRIREIGSDVRPAVTPDVDFVIFTESEQNKPRESYPEFRRAVLLEIPMAYAGRVEERPDVPGIYEFLGD